MARAGAQNGERLTCSHETPAGELHLFLGLPAQRRGCDAGGVSPEEAMKLIKGTEHLS